MSVTGGKRPTLRALDQLGDRLVAAERDLSPASNRVRIVTLVIGVIAVLIGLSFTPPGRVVAGEVGELVGIGDEPTVPTRVANELDAVVIGTGSTPADQPFEIVASLLDDPSDVPELCFDLDLATPARPIGGVCITSARNQQLLEEEGFGPVSVSSHSALENTDLVVRGAMTSDVTEVTVTYVAPDGAVHEAAVAHGQLTPDLSAQIGSEWTAGAFVAFLPEGVIERPEGGARVIDYRQIAELMASIEITTYDADGNVVATTGIGDPERAATFVPMSPPARLVDDFKALDRAFEQCRAENPVPFAVPVDPKDPIGSLEKAVNPELERCAEEKLSQSSMAP